MGSNVRQGFTYVCFFALLMSFDSHKNFYFEHDMLHFLL